MTYTDEQLRAWREEYGVYTFAPPPDWQPPEGRLLTVRYRVAGQLWRLSNVARTLACRLEPRPPSPNDVLRGRMSFEPTPALRRARLALEVAIRRRPGAQVTRQALEYPEAVGPPACPRARPEAMATARGHLPTYRPEGLRSTYEVPPMNVRPCRTCHQVQRIVGSRCADCQQRKLLKRRDRLRLDRRQGVYLDCGREEGAA